MLVLSRKVGESIRLGDQIEVTVVAVKGNHIRLGISAPAEVRVLRSELKTFDPPHTAESLLVDC